ncbi:MAG: hypothetical protein ACLQB1_06620 [Streptosporangiaceae bacterium]
MRPARAQEALRGQTALLIPLYPIATDTCDHRFAEHNTPYDQGGRSWP